MRVHKKKPGFILIFTLLFISLCVGLATYLFIKAQVYSPYMRAMIDREKARTLALSGIQIALSEVSYFPTKEKQGEPGETKRDAAAALKKRYERVLPVLNRWQEFTLKQASDGVDAKLRVCISAENGKININELYDFKKHAFKGEGSQTNDMKKVAQDICTMLQKITGQADLFTTFETFLKKRSYALNDATELLPEKSFAVFKRALFYEPPVDVSAKKRPLYLTDLFTTWSGSAALNPVLLSDSVCGLFSFSRVQVGDEEKRKTLIQGLLKEVSLQSTNPEHLKKLATQFYGKDFTTLPKSIHSILHLSDEPLVFCVLSSATVNEVTQRAYAIIACASAQESEGAISFEGTIKKVYWL